VVTDIRHLAATYTHTTNTLTAADEHIIVLCFCDDKALLCGLGPADGKPSG
jgi:hypothetical protein